MNEPTRDLGLSAAVIALLKGVVYRENDASLWQSLLILRARVREHVAIMGLDLIVDEAEGYAYLRQQPRDENDDDELPRVIVRRQLSYPVSLVLALLRKRLAEFDTTSSDARLILSRDEITDLVRVFLPEKTNEARLLDRVETNIEKVVQLGFLRRLRGSEDRFEVRRVIKAFIDAQWLGEFNERLATYRDVATGATSAEDAQ